MLHRHLAVRVPVRHGLSVLVNLHSDEAFVEARVLEDDAERRGSSEGRSFAAETRFRCDGESDDLWLANR